MPIVDITQLGVFAQIKPQAGTSGDTILNFTESGIVKSGGTYNGLNPFRAANRSETEREANNEARSRFLLALGRTYGLAGVGIDEQNKFVFTPSFIEDLKSALGPELLETLRFNEDFSFDEAGHISCGKPLTERRISLVTDQLKKANMAPILSENKRDLISIGLDLILVDGFSFSVRDDEVPNVPGNETRRVNFVPKLIARETCLRFMAQHHFKMGDSTFNPHALFSEPYKSEMVTILATVLQENQGRRFRARTEQIRATDPEARLNENPRELNIAPNEPHHANLLRMASNIARILSREQESAQTTVSLGARCSVEELNDRQTRIHASEDFIAAARGDQHFQRLMTPGLQNALKTAQDAVMRGGDVERLNAAFAARDPARIADEIVAFSKTLFFVIFTERQDLELSDATRLLQLLVNNVLISTPTAFNALHNYSQADLEQLMTELESRKERLVEELAEIDQKNCEDILNPNEELNPIGEGKMQVSDPDEIAQFISARSLQIDRTAYATMTTALSAINSAITGEKVI